MKVRFLILMMFFMVTTSFSQSIGLSELLDLTVEINPDLKIQKNILDNSRMDRKINKNSLLPSFSMNYTQTRDKGKNTAALEHSLFTYKMNKNFSGLFMGDSAKSAIADISLRKSDLNYNMQKNNLLFAAYDYYFRIVRKVNELELYKKNMELIEELLKVAKINKDAGIGLESDVLRVEAQKISISIQLESAKNELKNILLGLNAFLNNSYSELYKAVESFLDNGGNIDDLGLNYSYKFPQVDFDLNTFIKDGIDRDLSLKILKEDIDMAKSLYKQARLALYPDVNVNVSKTEIDSTDTPAVYKDNEYALSLVFSQDIYDYGTKGLKIKKARNIMNNAQLSYDYSKNIKEAQLRQTYTDYMENRSRTKAAEKSSEHANENLRLLKERFKAGDAGIVELIDAQVLLTNTKLSELKAYYDERITLGNMYLNINNVKKFWELANE